GRPGQTDTDPRDQTPLLFGQRVAQELPALGGVGLLEAAHAPNLLTDPVPLPIRATPHRHHDDMTQPTRVSRDQMPLDGFDEFLAEQSYPFRLDDETCRIGLEKVAEMRRILDGFAERAA
ncbi:MAG: hypothetical protein RL547_906, partial [Actinomycetota bacterium]